jgi:hypothetical protein
MTVAGFMFSEKVATIAEFTGTPAGPGVDVAGTVRTTVGRVVSAVTPVVKVHT